MGHVHSFLSTSSERKLYHVLGDIPKTSRHCFLPINAHWVWAGAGRYLCDELLCSVLRDLAVLEALKCCMRYRKAQQRW
jgi:hypothetical protein